MKMTVLQIATLYLFYRSLPVKHDGSFDNVNYSHIATFFKEFSGLKSVIQDTIVLSICPFSAQKITCDPILDSEINRETFLSASQTDTSNTSKLQDVHFSFVADSTGREIPFLFPGIVLYCTYVPG